MNAVVFIPELCTGCQSCEMVCSLFHEGFCSPDFSRIQVRRWDEFSVYIPILCQHCKDAPCILVCPTKARTRDTKTGAAVTNEKWCVGCKACIMACPYSAPLIHPKTGKSVSCDLCGGKPLCVSVCSVGALTYTLDGHDTNKRRRISAENIIKSSKQWR